MYYGKDVLDTIGSIVDIYYKDTVIYIINTFSKLKHSLIV